MEAAMLCKMETKKRVGKSQETVASENNPRKKLKYTCIVETHESRRKSLESILPRNHEDHIPERRCNSLTRDNLVHKFIQMAQAMKIPDAKAAVDKEWTKLETIPAWQLDKV